MLMAVTFATLSPALASFRDQMSESYGVCLHHLFAETYERFSHDEACERCYALMSARWISG